MKIYRFKIPTNQLYTITLYLFIHNNLCNVVNMLIQINFKLKKFEISSFHNIEFAQLPISSLIGIPIINSLVKV